MASAAVSDDDLAVTEARAAKMVGFSVRRLRAWASRNILGPGVERRLSERKVVRLYRFQDLVELHVARALLDQGRSPQQIRKVVHHLRSRDYGAPLAELRFEVRGDHIYFQHPDGTWEGDRAPDQIVLHSVLDLEGIRALVREAVAPNRLDRRAGNLVQKRGVVGGKPVFEGTRIPVTAVEPYLRRGMPDERILEAFPLLTEADLEDARRTVVSAQNLRFLLDNDVDSGVATVLRRGGHDVVTASDVGLAGIDSAEDDELPVQATDRDRAVITHDREFTSRRERNTIGSHVRIRVEQPDAPDLIHDRLDELIEALNWTESAVVEVFRTRVRHYPPRWD